MYVVFTYHTYRTKIKYCDNDRKYSFSLRPRSCNISNDHNMALSFIRLALCLREPRMRSPYRPSYYIRKYPTEPLQRVPIFLFGNHAAFLPKHIYQIYTLPLLLKMWFLNILILLMISYTVRVRKHEVYVKHWFERGLSSKTSPLLNCMTYKQ